MSEPVFEIEEVNDPVEVARCKAQDERARRNSDWLQSHWADLLPQREHVRRRGRSGGVHRGHSRRGLGHGTGGSPRDDGALSQYVFPGQGPRIYQN